MKITVQRLWFDSVSTMGKLFIDGKEFCYTLEDACREIYGQPIESWKVPGKTAIPYGTYKLDITMSGRFNRLMPQVMDVPGFAGIRIHSGNTSADTEGCLLVGSTKSSDFIGNSRDTFVQLFEILQSAKSQGEEITIEYVKGEQ